MLNDLIGPRGNRVKHKPSIWDKSSDAVVSSSVIFRDALWRLTNHEIHKFAIKLRLVEIVLNFDFAFAEMRTSGVGPDERVSVGYAVNHRDVEIDFVGFGDDGRIEPGNGGEFVPQVA